jgi:hypothetical protein
MAIKTYAGSCRCREVRFEGDMDLAAGSVRCNCSICTKSRARFAFVTPDHFRLIAGRQGACRLSVDAARQTAAQLALPFLQDVWCPPGGRQNAFN